MESVSSQTKVDTSDNIVKIVNFQLFFINWILVYMSIRRITLEVTIAFIRLLSQNYCKHQGESDRSLYLLPYADIIP